jgi:aarF domain-containing kinase
MLCGENIAWGEEGFFSAALLLEITIRLISSRTKTDRRVGDETQCGAVTRGRIYLNHRKRGRKLTSFEHNFNHATTVHGGVTEENSLFCYIRDDMSGQRLLDAIQFLNVTKSVATKHLAVRQRQLDVFTRTSSLTKGIKSQTDGLILTARAAAELAKRFNDSPSDHATNRSEPSPPTQADQFRVETQIPSSATGASKDTGTGILDVSPQQEEFYRPSGEPAPESAGTPRVIIPRATNDTQVGFDKDINADVFRSPIAATSVAAGGIAISPQQEESYQPSPEPAAASTETPRNQISQATSTTQMGIDKDINANVYQSSMGTGKAATEPQNLSEDMMKDIFHSPRVARVLSRKPPADSRFRVESKKREPIIQAFKKVEPSIVVEDMVTPDSNVSRQLQLARCPFMLTAHRSSRRLQPS